MNHLSQTESILKILDALSKITDIKNTYGIDKINEMSVAISKLEKEEAILTLTTAKLSDEDKKAILIKAGLITAEEAETLTINKDTLSKYENLKASELLRISWEKFKTTKLFSFITNPWVLATAAIIGATVAIINYKKAQKEALEESIEKTETAVSEYESLTSEVETLEEKLADLQKQIDDTDSIVSDDDLKNLEDEKSLIEAELVLLREKQALAKEEARNSAKETLNKKVSSEYGEIITNTNYIAGETVHSTLVTGYEDVTLQEELDKAIQAYQRYETQKNQLISEGVDKNASEILELNQKMIDARTHAAELRTELGTVLDGLDSDLDKEEYNSVKTSIDTYNTFTKTIHENTDALKENSEAQSQNSNKTGISFADIFELEDAEGKATALGKLNNELDEFQKTYTGLKEIMDSYNKTGTFTLDQVQEILSYGDEYLKYLMDENGNLQLNEEALNNVAKARIEEMRAKALSNLADNLKSIETEDQALDYLKTKLYETADAYNTVAASALIAWQNEARRNGISDTTIDKVTKQYLNKAKAINEMFDNIDIGSVSSSKSSSAETDFKDILDKYLSLYEAELDAGLISFDNFLDKSRSMIEQYYADGKITAADYWDYVGNLYEKQLNIYDKALSGMTYIIDKEVESLEKEKEIIEKTYQLKIDAIQSEIDSLEEANNQRKTAMELERAQYNLQKALNQKNKKVNYMPSYYSNVVCKK